MSSYELNKSRYTHRDYDSIKEDLINAIPSLTKEWTSREESDPGIVLVKLMSMFGDSLSYNIDKMALELYLQTVSQRKNCARILELLGYKMHWYRSGRVAANVKLNSFENATGVYTHVVLRPYQTTFWTSNRSIPYTVVGNDEIDIYSDSTAQTVYLVQGSPITFNFTRSDLINNRYYFGSPNIDEDEIILNISGTSELSVTCKLVDSLYTSSSSNIIYYEFNVDEYDRPYIKLADGWEDITGTNSTEFSVTCLLTKGASGNVSDDTLKIIQDAEGNTYNLNITHRNNTTKYIPVTSDSSDSAVYDNYSAPGQDPQTTDEAREDAFNFVFTHDTLVTSSDYEKACKRVDGITFSKLVDNQVIINDGLDINDLVKRANDNWELEEEGSELKPYFILMYLIYRYFDAENNIYCVPPSSFNPENKPMYNLNITGSNSGVDYYWDNYWKNNYYAYVDNGKWVIPEDIDEREDPEEAYPGYYPYKIQSSIQNSVTDLISNLKLVNKNVDYGTVKLYPFKVQGTVYLVDTYSPEETLQILDNIDSALSYFYDPERYDVSQSPNFIDLVNIIQNSDDRIRYFDAIGNIVEWAPVVKKAQDSNRLESFDSTSAVVYQGLYEDNFNFNEKFLRFNLYNSGALSNSKDNLLEVRNSDGSIYKLPDFNGTAYLFNYSEVSRNDGKIVKIDVAQTLKFGTNGIKISNIEELRALCEDLHFSGNTGLPIVTVYEDGTPPVITTSEDKFISNTIEGYSTGDQYYFPAYSRILKITDKFNKVLDSLSSVSVRSNTTEYTFEVTDPTDISYVNTLINQLGSDYDVILTFNTEGTVGPNNEIISHKIKADDIVITWQEMVSRKVYTTDMDDIDENAVLEIKSVYINNSGVRWEGNQ